jgi:hypothetical protein
MQSVFYAWRATGNMKYYNFAKSGIAAIAQYLKSNAGYAPLNNVTSTAPGTSNQSNNLEVWSRLDRSVNARLTVCAHLPVILLRRGPQVSVLDLRRPEPHFAGHMGL